MASLNSLHSGLFSQASPHTTPWMGSAARLSPPAPDPRGLLGHREGKGWPQPTPLSKPGQCSLRSMLGGTALTSLPDHMAVGKCGWHTPAGQKCLTQSTLIRASPTLSSTAQPSPSCLTDTQPQMISGSMAGRSEIQLCYLVSSWTAEGVGSHSCTHSRIKILTPMAAGVPARLDRHRAENMPVWTGRPPRGSLLGPLHPCLAHGGHRPTNAGETWLSAAAQGGGHQGTAASLVAPWRPDLLK